MAGSESSRIHELLVNWAHWCEWGAVGPPVQTHAASAEGRYIPELGEVWEPEEARIEPNFRDGERMEELICSLPELQRRVLKMKYVAHPYQTVYTLSQKLKISADRFESELRKGKEALWRRWSNEALSGSSKDLES